MSAPSLPDHTDRSDGSLSGYSTAAWLFGVVAVILWAITAVNANDDAKDVGDVLAWAAGSMALTVLTFLVVGVGVIERSRDQK